MFNFDILLVECLEEPLMELNYPLLSYLLPTQAITLLIFQLQCWLNATQLIHDYYLPSILYILTVSMFIYVTA